MHALADGILNNFLVKSQNLHKATTFFQPTSAIDVYPTDTT